MINITKAKMSLKELAELENAKAQTEVNSEAIEDIYNALVELAEIISEVEE